MDNQPDRDHQNPNETLEKWRARQYSKLRPSAPEADQPIDGKSLSERVFHMEQAACATAECHGNAPSPAAVAALFAAVWLTAIGAIYWVHASNVQTITSPTISDVPRVV